MAGAPTKRETMNSLAPLTTMAPIATMPAMIDRCSFLATSARGRTQ
jgi:hypothetical protein